MQYYTYLYIYRPRYRWRCLVGDVGGGVLGGVGGAAWSVGVAGIYQPGTQAGTTQSNSVRRSLSRPN